MLPSNSATATKVSDTNPGVCPPLPRRGPSLGEGRRGSAWINATQNVHCDAREGKRFERRPPPLDLVLPEWSFMPPRVTVIIATYNWSTVLPYSIGSVLQQTLTDFELLVVGDGCTDDSESVVAGFADPRVRWINLPANSGHQSAPNNEGLRQARGEFIAYLGHDDLWLPHHLAALLEGLGTDNDLAFSLLAFVGPEGKFLRPNTPQPQQGFWMPPSCVVHRRRVTEQLSGWRDYRELSISPDIDLWRRAHASGFKFVFVPRLTGVKFPAIWRRGVYRDRPSHEQAAWFARIRSEPNLEVVELARMAVEAYGSAGRRRLFLEFFTRLWRRVSTPSEWLSFFWRRKGARFEVQRKIKGLERTR